MIDKYVRFGWIAKHMLYKKAYYPILEGLLSVLTGEKISILEIRPSKTKRELSDELFARLNICSQNKRGHVLLFQLQTSDDASYLERMIFGLSDLQRTAFEYMVPFSMAKNIINVNVVYEDTSFKKDNMYYGKIKLRGAHTKETLDLEILRGIPAMLSFPLPKFFLLVIREYDIFENRYNRPPIVNTAIDEWLYYLETGRIPDDFTASGLIELRECFRLDRLTSDELASYNEYLDKRNLYRMVSLYKQEEKLEKYISNKLKSIDEELNKKIIELKRKYTF